MTNAEEMKATIAALANLRSLAAYEFGAKWALEYEAELIALLSNA